MMTGRGKRMLRLGGGALLALAVVGVLALARPTAPDTVWLDSLTWVETAALIEAGTTVAIIPTGGTEQNGPHMVLGKHNAIVAHAAGRIARELGNALVAPVMAYVPEGAIDPPEGHMRFAGTLSLPEPVFEAVLEHAARSLRAHGFTLICLLGDSGGNQAAQARVAAMLSREWAADGVRVLHVGDYYAASGQVEHLLAAGESEASIGGHAGIRDTSELMAVWPEGVRGDRLGPGMPGSGADGDSSRASAARGETLLALKVAAALRQIRAAQ